MPGVAWALIVGRKASIEFGSLDGLHTPLASLSRATASPKVLALLPPAAVVPRLVTPAAPAHALAPSTAALAFKLGLLVDVDIAKARLRIVVLARFCARLWVV